MSKYQKACKLNSEILRQACLDLFQRCANRKHTTLNQEMAEQLGSYSRPVIPGCERAIRGQFAARRLAA